MALRGMRQSIPRWYHAEGKSTPDAVARKYVEIAMKTVGSTEEPVKPKKRRTADV